MSTIPGWIVAPVRKSRLEYQISGLTLAWIWTGTHSRSNEMSNRWAWMGPEPYQVRSQGGETTAARQRWHVGVTATGSGERGVEIQVPRLTPDEMPHCW